MSIEQNFLLIACEEGRDDMLRTVLLNKKLAATPFRPSSYQKKPQESASRDPACNLQPHAAIMRGSDGQAYTVNINEPLFVPGKWNGSRLVHIAAANGHLNCLQRLVDVMGAEYDPRDPRGCTPCYLASHFGHEAIVRYLLEAHKANPDACNNEGLTPLCKACSKGHLTIVKALLDGGADIHLSGKDQRSPLHLAAAAGHIDVVLELIQRGASLDMTENTHLYTPLHLAASNGYHSVVKLLIQKGAEVEMKDRHGDTALILAARHNRPQMIRILIDDGKANILSRNNKGRTALEEANVSHTRTAACVSLLKGIEDEVRVERGLGASTIVDTDQKRESRSSCPGVMEPSVRQRNANEPWIPPSAPFQATWEKRRREPILLIKKRTLYNKRD